MAAETESTPASTSTLDEDVKKLMGKGKVHMVCNEYLEAVKCFEEATQKLDEKFGQAHDECGEAYFYYGKSLLEVARMEGGILGNALQGAIDPDTQENGDGDEKTDKKSEEHKKDSEKDNENKKDTDAVEQKDKELFETSKEEKITKDEKEKAMEETEAKKEEPEEKKEDDVKGEQKKEDAKDKEMKGDAKDKEKKEDAKDEEKKKDAKDKEKKGDVKVEEKKDAEGEEEEEDDDEDEPMDEDAADDIEVSEAAAEEDEPTYMELSWQMLEVARITFEKRENKEGKLMLAQCHLKLGEIQMEQEQFLSAVEDFLKCLDIQKEHLEPDNRLLAETAYNIGLAFSFQSMYEKSRTYYSQALETIDLRIKSLQKTIDEAETKSKGKEKATDDNPVVLSRKELQELKELYPEIKAKVDDAKEMIQQAKIQPSVSSAMGNGSSTTIGFGDSTSTSAPVTMIATKAPVAVTDISHLVHRNKRKPEEASEDVTSAKKPRQDPEVAESNGKPATNGKPTTNGKTEAAPTET